MLNLALKKYNPTFLFKILKYKSSIHTSTQGWINHIENNGRQRQSISNEKVMQSQLKNRSSIPIIRQELFENNQYIEDDYVQQNYQGQRNDEQKKIVREKFIGQKTLNQQVTQLFDSSATQLPINKFCRVTKSETKIKYSQSINQAFTYALKQKQRKQILRLIKNYLKIHGYNQGGLANKVTKGEKILFKKLHDLLLKSIQDPLSVRQLLKNFSQCNPNLIKINQISKVSQMQKSIDNQQNKKKSKFQYLTPDISSYDFFKSQDTLSPTAASLASQFIVSSNPYYTPLHKQSIVKDDDETANLIESLDEQHSVSKFKKLKLSKVRFFVKAQKFTQFKTDPATIEKVEKKIFGNKKMVTQDIVFKRVENKSNQKFNQYGQNWVYAYDLPYQIDEQSTYYILQEISKKYGPISEYSVQSFKNFVQKNQQEKLHILPFNFMDQSTKTKVKIQKQFGYNISQRLNEKQLSNNSNNKKVQSLVSRIIKKAKKYKELRLQKSTMTFKFQNIQDKIKFLTPEMRLYGLNLPGFQNIRFQQAQSKNIIILSMVPWACQSAELIRFINDSLTSLRITVTHPNCIISSGYIFIEMANFYQAFYAKDLLNNLIFQNQRLKAQLIYGPSLLNQGKYKHRYDFDYFEQLSNRLAELRNQKSELYT